MGTRTLISISCSFACRALSEDREYKNRSKQLNESTTASNFCISKYIEMNHDYFIYTVLMNVYVFRPDSERFLL